MIKRFLFGGIPVPSFYGELAFLGLRVYVGLAMAFGHGLAKFPPPEKFVEGVADMGFPAPGVFAWLASISEFLGGIALALGLLTRPAALGVLFTMAVAGLIRHAPDPFKVKELSFLYFFCALLFFAMGSGRFGIDRFFRGSR